MMLGTSGNVGCSSSQCEPSQPPTERGECSLGHCLPVRVQQGAELGVDVYAVRDYFPGFQLISRISNIQKYLKEKGGKKCR